MTNFDSTAPAKVDDKSNKKNGVIHHGWVTMTVAVGPTDPSHSIEVNVRLVGANQKCPASKEVKVKNWPSGRNTIISDGAALSGSLL